MGERGAFWCDFGVTFGGSPHLVLSIFPEPVEGQMGRWQTPLRLTEGGLGQRGDPSVTPGGRATSPLVLRKNGEDRRCRHCLYPVSSVTNRLEV